MLLYEQKIELDGHVFQGEGGHQKAIIIINPEKTPCEVAEKMFSPMVPGKLF